MKPVEPIGAPRARFNLSEWALQHRSVVLFAIIVFAFVGTLAYQRLGQSEDPPFTFKVMVIKTQWPGASARDVEQQVTDKIERKLQEVNNIDYVRSYSKPGESLVFFAIKDSAPPALVPETWYQVRKKIGDIRGTLPPGIQGPFFNDEFGDTYTNIYAIVGDGFGYRDLKDFGDRIRAELPIRLAEQAQGLLAWRVPLPGAAHPAIEEYQVRYALGVASRVRDGQEAGVRPCDDGKSLEADASDHRLDVADARVERAIRDVAVGEAAAAYVESHHPPAVCQLLERAEPNWMLLREPPFGLDVAHLRRPKHDERHPVTLAKGGVGDADAVGRGDVLDPRRHRAHLPHPTRRGPPRSRSCSARLTSGHAIPGSCSKPVGEKSGGMVGIVQ